MDEYQKAKAIFEQQNKMIRLLRNGEKVNCSKCKVGYMRPLGGTFKNTTTFICDHCQNQLILN